MVAIRIPRRHSARINISMKVIFPKSECATMVTMGMDI